MARLSGAGCLYCAAQHRALYIFSIDGASGKRLNICCAGWLVHSFMTTKRTLKLYGVLLLKLQCVYHWIELALLDIDIHSVRALTWRNCVCMYVYWASFDWLLLTLTRKIPS